MIKTYCDFCKKVIPDYKDIRYLEFGSVTSIHGVRWHLHANCLIAIREAFGVGKDE